MNNWTIPRRITLGYVLLILLAILLGLTSLWKIRDINQQVTALATNTVPSVVLLNKINENTIRLRRMASRTLLTEGATRTAAENSFRSDRTAGDQFLVDYKSLVSDDKDRTYLEDVKQARTTLVAACEKVIAAANREGGKEEAQAVLINDVDPALANFEELMGKHVKHNVKLGDEAASAALRIVFWSYLGVGGTLALATLLGSLVGWLTVRATRQSLGGISNSLESGATHTSTASHQLASSSQSLAEGTAEQGASVAETSAALEQMSVMTRSTSDNAASNWNK